MVKDDTLNFDHTSLSLFNELFQARKPTSI